MKEMQLILGTTPKGKSVTRNQILAQKQLWVDEMDFSINRSDSW